MGCCLLAAIVIGRWLALWDGLRLRLRRAGAWLLRQPLPAVGIAAPPASRPLRFGRKARAFVVAEVTLLALLGWHSFGSGHEGGGLHAHAAAVRGEIDAALCTASSLGAAVLRRED